MGGRDGRGVVRGRRRGKGKVGGGNGERSEILKGCWKYSNQVYTAGDQLPLQLFPRRLSAS